MTESPGIMDSLDIEAAESIKEMAEFVVTPKPTKKLSRVLTPK